VGGASRVSLFAAAIGAVASSVAIAAAPSRQGRAPMPEYRPVRLPPPAKRRPPPSQAEITRVIDENLSSIKVCYQRALARDASLTGGKIAVKLTIGISGRVKHVGIDGLAQLRVFFEPCVREAVSRWIFPQASEEYGTEFPFVFQSNAQASSTWTCALPYPDLEPESVGNGCSITVNTVPWSEVWIDGKNTTRHTPIVDFKLPCGKHKLGFKRPDLAIDHAWTINLRPGTAFKQRYELTNDGSIAPRLRRPD